MNSPGSRPGVFAVAIGAGAIRTANILRHRNFAPTVQFCARLAQTPMVRSACRGESAVNRRPRRTDIAQHAGLGQHGFALGAHQTKPGISESVRQEIFRIAAGARLSNPGGAARAWLQQAIALVPIDQATGGLSVFYEGIFEGLRSAASRAGATLAVRLARTEVFRNGARGPARFCRSRRRLPRRNRSAGRRLPLARKLGSPHGVGERQRSGSASVKSPRRTSTARLATRRLLAAGHPPDRALHPCQPAYAARAGARGFEAGIASVHGATGRIVRSISRRTAWRAGCGRGGASRRQGVQRGILHERHDRRRSSQAAAAKACPFPTISRSSASTICPAPR